MAESSQNSESGPENQTGENGQYPDRHELEGEHQSASEDGEDESSDSQTVVAQIQSYQEISGPLPHPSIVKGYEDVLPGAAERVFQMAEKERDHRHDIDKQLVDSETRSRSTGQWMGFALAVIALCASVYLGVNGYPKTGGVIGVAALGGAFSSPLIQLLFSRDKKKTDEN